MTDHDFETLLLLVKEISERLEFYQRQFQCETGRRCQALEKLVQYPTTEE